MCVVCSPHIELVLLFLVEYTCSLNRSENILPVCPTYFVGHSLHLNQCKILSLCLFSDVFFDFSNRSLCVINLVSSPLYVVNVRYFFLLLVDDDDVYVVAAADSGFVVVLAVLTR